MTKTQIGTLYFMGGILNWFQTRGMCWIHGCFMDSIVGVPPGQGHRRIDALFSTITFSEFVPVGKVLMLCPVCYDPRNMLLMTRFSMSGLL